MTADWAGRDIVIGSLFSGFGGLDDGTHRALLALGARSVRVAWVADIDPGASRILAHHYPGVPNLGDITAIDWTATEPVDVVTGGFPCQDVSTAGNQAGLRPGTRSGLWAHMCYAVSILRPQLVVAENVRGLLSAPAHSDVEPCPWCLGDANSEPPVRALGAVLADLADIGYDAQWQGLRASDVGAPHARFRVFVVAQPATHTSDVGHERPGSARRRGPGPADGCVPVADTDVTGPQGPEPAAGSDVSAWCSAADRRYEGWPESAVLVGGPHAPERRHAATPHTERSGWDGRAQDEVRRPVGRAAVARRGHAAADSDGAGSGSVGRVDTEQHDLDGRDRPHSDGHPGEPETRWGPYGPAITRWATVLGRPAPAPTQPGKTGPRLSPRFVEWMMGLPDGHVTDVPGLKRNDMLKALGNGVVPQQAERALRVLLSAGRAS